MADFRDQLFSLAAGRCDRGQALLQLYSKTSEVEANERRIRERREVLEQLKQYKEELQQMHRKTLERQKQFFQKNEDLTQICRKSDREEEEALRLEAKLEKLKKGLVAMKEIQQATLCEMQRRSVFWDYLQRVCRVTKFEEPRALADHVESLLDLKQQLLVRENEAQQKVDLQKKSLAALEDQHHLLALQKHNELAKLQTEYEKVHYEAFTWEKKWKHIQETAAKKTLTLGQIKMAILNLYEMTGVVVGKEGVDMNDTEKQLAQIKVFLTDSRDIVQHVEQTEASGKRCDKAKKFLRKRK